MPNMQVLCPYYVKDHMKAMLHWQMCGFISQILALPDTVVGKIKSDSVQSFKQRVNKHMLFDG